jgi:hypothetical protein
LKCRTSVVLNFLRDPTCQRILVQNDPFALAGGHDRSLFVGGGIPNGVSHFGLWLGSLPYFWLFLVNTNSLAQIVSF